MQIHRTKIERSNYPSFLIPLAEMLQLIGFSTCGVSETGTAGTDMVVDFGTLQHTAYLYCGFAGMYEYITAEVSTTFTYFSFTSFTIFFSSIFSHCVMV